MPQHWNYGRPVGHCKRSSSYWRVLSAIACLQQLLSYDVATVNVLADNEGDRS
jgi:hypothetical protein